MNFLRGTKLYSIITGACPVCQEESMYKESNPYKLHKTLKMEDRCSHCGTKYKIEPSFFYGAMYVSYPVGIAFAVAAFVISNLIFKLSLLGTFFVIVGTMIAFMPIIMRLARNIWINFFMHYKKEQQSS
ncbi:DUF983 domain-containing protein [Aquimarina intermedia]|uniref:Uncharacterized protein DUF983 n=1 Tax=Aquimarina intermedia TaxID=350814 RepID=A0A5S5CD69_9FLAO|nr:DUF983 domain-containing protein [Aquimarina intermedia]TYP77304.1 uncharacterized protein DUF983 [Aquimarina intermedia]